MTLPSLKAATYADLLALPDHQVGQLVDGELIVMPRPSSSHARVTSTLGMDLGGPYQRGRGGPGGWWILDEMELHFGTNVLVPDLIGYRVERMPNIPSANFFTLAPDWVCEVLSPKTASFDRVSKSRIYAREGVSYLWLIDPLAQCLEAYQLRDGVWVQLGTWRDNETPRVAPFEAIELTLADLWTQQTE